ncbi:MAG: hypothetical protein QGI49_10875 [SAR202 cluster bacterium]|nr:hypothetical protein [SAR202 cluster bacterium]
MGSETASEAEGHFLAVELHQAGVPVSYLSSLLRVLQAALREVALTNDQTREQFSSRPQPVLVMPDVSRIEALVLSFSFVHPINGTTMDSLSSSTFDSFLDHLGKFIAGLPQPGLWGGAARRSPQEPFESELDRRMDQIYAELRRTSKVVLRFQTRSLEIEGDQMVIM